MRTGLLRYFGGRPLWIPLVFFKVLDADLVGVKARRTTVNASSLKTVSPQPVQPCPTVRSLDLLSLACPRDHAKGINVCFSDKATQYFNLSQKVSCLRVKGRMPR
jgi:hypothetical protein